MIDTAAIPRTRIDWRDARRIVRGAFPPIDVFEDIADPADWPLLIEAARKSDPSVVASIGALDLVPPARRVSGKGSSHLMAPFTHASPDRPSRFTSGAFGVLYVTERFETALLETIHHHARFMALTDEQPGWTSRFLELKVDVGADLHDLRGGHPEFSPFLVLDDYSAGQTLGAMMRSAGSDGLVYPSRRDPDGTCAGLFHPDLASNVREGRALDYHWDGTRVDIVRDAGSRRLFRIVQS